MKAILSAVVGLSLVAVLAGPAAAQGRGGFGGRGGGGGSLAFLLGNASVQKELKLSDEQVTKAKELAEKINGEAREKYQGLQDLSQEERREKMQTITHEINTEVVKSAGEFLKPEQITRLKQISYHTRGVAVFADHEVAKKLNLTEAQKSEIKAIGDEMQSEMQSIRQEMQEDPQGAMKKMTELRKSTLAKAAGKLNDEQQKTWKELVGAPFELVMERRPPQ
jgi:hypothetical protein